MTFDPLENASSDLRDAVEAMGGSRLLAAIDQLVQDNEEDTVEWFDAQWDDLVAEEILDWRIAQLAKTGPTVAHAVLDVSLRTYPVDDEDESALSGDATIVSAFIRVVVRPQIRADRYELGFQHLGEWIRHDAIRFVDEPRADGAEPD